MKRHPRLELLSRWLVVLLLMVGVFALGWWWEVTRLKALVDEQRRHGGVAELGGPSPEAPGEALAEAQPPTASPLPALAPPDCPPQRSCEAELQQLTVALEANVRQAEALERLRAALAAGVERRLRGFTLSAEDGIAAGGLPRLTIPDKPYSWQKPPPCNAERAEVAINGACWVATDKVAPCPELAEHAGKCYRPVEKAKPAPPQSETRDSEAR